jgi:CHAT domain
MTDDAICAVLSVAEVGHGDTVSVQLTVQEYAAVGLRRQRVSARLDRETVAAIRDSAAELGACLNQDTPDKDRISAGKQLFEMAFRNNVGQLWRRVRAQAGVDHRLRVRFDVRPDWLRALPWEMLRGGQDWIFLERNMFAWRGPDPQPASQDTGPLRVLVVVCNPMDERILAEQELAEITSALAGQLGQCHVEILDGPSRLQLSAEIDRLRPHVLHFIGHGMPRPGGGGTELFFNWVPKNPQPAAGPYDQADADDDTRLWGLASSDVKYLADWVPRLVIVNACRTADDPVDPIGGFANAFLEAGARAVVSMQSEIQSPSAVLFSAALYKGLRDFAPLDQILNQTRRQLYQDSGVTGDWVLPVLATGTDPAEVLRISYVPTRPLISHLCSRPEYGQLQQFLGRSAERWKLWSVADPLLQQPSARNVLVIGGRKVYERPPGKTWLTYWALFDCYLRGYRVTYVDLGKKFVHRVTSRDAQRKVSNKQWLDVVRVIRNACTSDQQLEPLPPSAFGEFNASLNRLVKTMLPEGLSSAIPGPEEDAGELFDEDGGRNEERIKRIFSEFLAALREAAGGRPHVIALDNAHNIVLGAGQNMKEVIYSELIRPIAQADDSLIRMIIVARDEWLGGLLPENLQNEAKYWTRLDIDGFQSAQFMRLAQDYCLRSGWDFKQAKKTFEAVKENWAHNPVIPVQIFEETIRLIPQHQRAG